MADNYEKIVRDNLNKLFSNMPEDLAKTLPGTQNGESYLFEAFGEQCQIRPDGIALGIDQQTSVPGILMSLYALYASTELCSLEPLKAFRDFPNSMPYAGAFTTHTENILMPHVIKIENAQEQIKENLKGQKPPLTIGGDFSFIVYPLPKIALCYIFYRADDEFPASVTCLYSNNASSFLPVDALADVGEYTSRKMLNILKNF